MSLSVIKEVPLTSLGIPIIEEFDILPMKAAVIESTIQGIVIDSTSILKKEKLLYVPVDIEMKPMSKVELKKESKPTVY